jgi:hypothetical protein
MAELSEGLDLSNIGTTTGEVHGITNNAMHFTSFEACARRTTPPTTGSTTGPRGPAMDLGTGRGSADQPPAGRAGDVMS